MNNGILVEFSNGIIRDFENLEEALKAVSGNEHEVVSIKEIKI